MNGVGGYSNWRWLFILEGIVAILVGILAYFIIVDFPEEAKWLTEDERRWVISRTEETKNRLKELWQQTCYASLPISRIFSRALYILVSVSGLY
jgi:sugar phosphate permease